MRRTVEVLLVIALVAAACGGSFDPVDTTSQAPATTADVPAETSATAAPEGDDLLGVPAAAAMRLMALEADNDGQWTIETALEAVAILRPILLEGVGGAPPINVTRLTAFLGENFDDVPADDWEQIIASGPQPTARLVAYQPTEAIRQVYQDIAERVDADFEARTGHRLNVPIHVALSDLTTFRDLHAGTWVGRANVEAFKWLFGDEDVWQVMADAVGDIAATSGEVCVIVLSAGLTDWSEDRQVAGLMHEIVHCHQNTVHPQGSVGFRATNVLWMDEGYAAWAGEAPYGGTLNSVSWWNEYFDGGVGSRSDGFSLYEGSYRAISFYSMLAAGGVDPFAQFVPWFNGLRANGVSNRARYEGMASGAAPDVVAGWTASASRNSDFGSPWDSATGPGIGASREAREPTTARAGAEPRPFVARPGEQRYWAVQFNTAVDQPSLITIDARGLGTYRWVHDDWKEQYVVTDTLSLAWCVGEDCVCEDGSSPAPDALLAPIVEGDRPVLHAALFGGAGGADLTASVASLEDACEEEEEPTGPLDACLFGTWNPDPDQYQDFLLTLYRMLPISELTLEGTIDLSFSDDGSFRQDYAGTRGSGVVEGERYEASFMGGSFGTWEASGGVLTLNFTGSDISVIVAGVPAVAPSIPPGTVEAGYTCTGPTLAVDPPPGTPGPFWPLPTDWFKST